MSLCELRTLVLVGSADMFEVLPHLLASSLTRLYLRSSIDPLGYPDQNTGSYITRFISVSSPPLELFELHDIDLTSAEFTTCFAGLPRLKELRLHESEISDSIIQKFHGPGPLCPLLNRLDLRWCGQVTGRALVELVRTRLSMARDGCIDIIGVPPASIDVITVINCSFVEEQHIYNLAQTSVCQVVMEADDYCSWCFV